MASAGTRAGRVGLGLRTWKASSYGKAGIGFLVPAIVILVGLLIYPLAYGVYISFFRTNLLNRWDFVALENYGHILGGSPFARSMALSALFAAAVVAGHFLLGGGLALALNRPLRGQKVFRTVLLLPWLFPEVVVGLDWRWLLNPLYGPVNYALKAVGLPGDVEWLGEPLPALLSVIIAAIWKGYPFVMIMLLAGLQTIPRDLYEAAQIDGASPWGEFRYVTLPSLVNVIAVVLILDTVWWFKHYTIVWVMTQGGPVDATNVVSIDIYRTAFLGFRFGEAAAMSVVVFLVCLAASFLYRRVLGHEA